MNRAFAFVGDGEVVGIAIFLKPGFRPLDGGQSLRQVAYLPVLITEVKIQQGHRTIVLFKAEAHVLSIGKKIPGNGQMCPQQLAEGTDETGAVGTVRL